VGVDSVIAQLRRAPGFIEKPLNGLGACGPTFEGLMGGDDERFVDKKLSDFRVFDKWLPSKNARWLPQIRALSWSEDSRLSDIYIT
jgi:hypothetical protein